MSTTLHGNIKPGFEPVGEAFLANFADGFEVGASVSVVHRGETVVDIWAGHTDLDRTTEWERDTITNVWSSTKTMMFLVLLELADKGALSLHDPVRVHWPEFGANGKESVTVAHLMAHTAGLPGWDRPMQPSDFYDHDLCASALAAQAPWWEPGTASGYHAISQGYLIGELVRRVTGVSLGTYFRTTFAEPLGADFHIGTPAECDARISNVIPPEPLSLAGADPSSIPVRTFSNPGMDAAQSWETGWRRCESAAANGHGNARSLALLQSVVSHGGEAGGRRFLSAAGVEKLFEVQAEGTDLVLGIPAKFGMGYGLNSENVPISPNPRACFWGGWGGSLVVNDLDAQMTFAYVMNRMGAGTVGDLRSAGPLMATYGAIG
jgi:CubicO group peptidase (beta-lactamase class C family)